MEVRLNADGVVFPECVLLAWPLVEEISAAPMVCFALEAGCLHKLQRFSEATNRFCSLFPTQAAPALMVAGFPMHRIKGTDPTRDTLTKIQAIGPIVGSVLDTTTGLGYTALQASRTAEHVVTVELDPAVLALARLNPWSRGLFDNPRLTQRQGDSYDLVTEYNDGTFARVVHDPPTLSLAGDLYSREFYEELHRVLARGGRLYHYVGDPASPLGRRVGRGVQQRLLEAGFERVRPAHAAHGLVAYK